jgi:hypothetical protein
LDDNGDVCQIESYVILNAEIAIEILGDDDDDGG